MELATLPMEELAKILELQLENGGRASLVVTGNSMYPMLAHRRDSVTLVPVTAPLRRGDLILYRRENGQYILHRIITKPKEGSFLCSGDNQWVREPVTQGQVMALVEGFVRKGRACTGEELFYRLYVAVWVAMFSVRRPLIRLRRRLGKFRADLRGKSNL